MNLHLRAALQTVGFLASVIGFWATALFAPTWIAGCMIVAVLGFSIWKLYQSNVESLRLKQEQKERGRR